MSKSLLRSRGRRSHQITIDKQACGYRILSSFLIVVRRSLGHLPILGNSAHRISRISILSFDSSMAPRITRWAAAKEASLVNTGEKENVPQQLSSPLPTPPLEKPIANTRKPRAKPKTTAKEAVPSPTTHTNLQRPNPTPLASQAISNPPKTKRVAKKTPSAVNPEEIAGAAPNTIASASRKRKRAAPVRVKADPEELPHGLGRITKASKVKATDVNDEDSPVAEKPVRDDITITKSDVEDIKSLMDTTIAASMIVDGESPAKKARRTKKVNPYGVVLGQTPYPDLLRPTPEECQKVNDILSEKHGAVAAPEEIPLPSPTVAGCGEVPCVLEALLRTLLSAHTSNGNAALAVQGLIKRFGILKSGMSRGCIDWNAARLAGREEIQDAIKRGGLAKSKSVNIEGILKMVYEENQARRAALAAKAKSPEATGKDNIIDPDVDTVDPDHAEAAVIEKASEVMLADTGTLTLDYMHAMSAESAFAKLITFPGIGVKTASCTLLFCMQRPSFAVDTHVFRLCKWLGWVPENATRDMTFAHCDVRVPDRLKYSLHQLLIRHGKECGRCRAITGENSEAWEEGCAIEDLVERTGKKKGGKESVNKGKPKKGSMDMEDEDIHEDQEEEAVGPKVKWKSKARMATRVKEDDEEVPEDHEDEAVISKVKPKSRARATTKRKKAKTKGKENGLKKPVDSDEDDGDDSAEDVAEDDDDYVEG